jgi:hypothetical protein
MCGALKEVGWSEFVSEFLIVSVTVALLIAG